LHFSYSSGFMMVIQKATSTFEFCFTVCCCQNSDIQNVTPGYERPQRKRTSYHSTQSLPKDVQRSLQHILALHTRALPLRNQTAHSMQPCAPSKTELQVHRLAFALSKFFLPFLSENKPQNEKTKPLKVRGSIPLT